LIKPYYDHAGITIYHADCREVLPELPKVDLVLTDPPYGIGRDGQSEGTGGHGGRKGFDFLGWDRVRPGRDVFQLILKASTNHCIWGGNYFSDYLPGSMGWIVWDKGQRINQSDGELAYTSRNKALRIIEINRAELLRDGTSHPTQKPLKLMKYCIGLFDVNGAILDPFMGSGTTLRAAKDLGRKAIGIELEEKYCEIAAKRLGQMVIDF